VKTTEAAASVASNVAAAMRLVQQFLHSSRQTVPILYNGPSLQPQNSTFATRDLMNVSLSHPSRHRQHLRT